MASNGPCGRLQGHHRQLVANRFATLCRELTRWRQDPEITEMDDADRILAFVRGLRLSAQLIYIIRTLLPAGLEAHWGHILGPDGERCSPECDVIIHREGACEFWNGSSVPVMEFYFVPHELAVAVVSCKSTKATAVDGLYPTKCHQYVKRVLLFAECCEVSDVNRLRNKAVECGYEGFWYLYTIDPATSPDVYTEEEPTWLEFAEHIMSILSDEGKRS